MAFYSIGGTARQTHWVVNKACRWPSRHSGHKSTQCCPSSTEYAIFETMRRRFLNILAFSLPLQWLLVRFAANHPEWVEQSYSLGLYPYISRFFRWLYGWIPFSIGDVLYILAIIYGIYAVFRYGGRIRTHFWSSLRNVTAGLAVLHLSFYLLWGLNYFRQPLSAQLGLEEGYDQEELIGLIEALTMETNRLQVELTGDSIQAVAIPYSRSEILEKTLEGYARIETDFPEFRYEIPSLKPSLISGLLSYMGYGGYLNPLTGEAQVNARLPLFRYPVVCAHEVSHQVGYSAENEANFIGYLVTQNQEDPYLQYSAAAYALRYCLADLARKDKSLSKALANRINPGVRANYAEMKAFWETYQNPMEPVFKAIFNRYLEANLQKDGIRSYNRVVALLVAYHRTRSAH